MTSALDVAKYFLVKSNAQDEEGEYISNLKLQKLLYYAQGYYIAMHDDKLFPERIEAWAHGPVVPDVYYKYNQYKGDSIPIPENFKIEVLTEEIRSFIDEVYTVVGQFSAWKLREMTHEETPWSVAWEQAPNTEITKEALKEYFLPLVNAN